MSRDYELGFILNPEVNEEQTQNILGRVEQVVANYGGRIVKVNQWGRRRMAYPIERHRDGYYVFIDMILTPETVAELDRTLRVSEEVLRHMMKRRDPRTVQKEREEREAREAREAAAAAEAASRAAEAAEAGAAQDEMSAPPALEAGNAAPDETATPADAASVEAPAAPTISEEELANATPAIDADAETAEA